MTTWGKQFLSGTAAVLLLASGGYAGRTEPVNITITRHPAQPRKPVNTTAIVRASSDVFVAQGQLNVVRARLVREFETSAEFTGALQNQIDARKSFERVRFAALTRLGANPGYAIALLELEKRDRLMSTVRGAPDVPFAQLSAAAKHVAEARAAVRAIEVASFKSDPDFETARYALIDAANRVAQLRSDFQSRLITDPDFLAAKDQLAAARQRYALAD